MPVLAFLLFLLLSFPLPSYAGTSSLGWANSDYVNVPNCSSLWDSAYSAAHSLGQSYWTGVYWFSDTNCYSDSGGSQAAVRVHAWDGSGDPLASNSQPMGMTYTDEQCQTSVGPDSVSTGEVEDGTGNACQDAPSGQDLADQECESIKPTFVTLSSNPGGVFSWDYAGCTFTTHSLWLETPSGEFSAVVASATGIVPDPSTVDETTSDATGSSADNASSDYTVTIDPDTDCPFSNISYDGVSYCYSGDDADNGEAYADSSTRVDHWDGSYTVTDSAGNSVTYNPDGTQQGTASNLPGAGPGGDGACPSWWCDGTGESGSGGEAPALPTEALDFSNGVSWSSGLATSATCPAPMTVPLSMGSWSSNIEFSYQGFCDFASMIRALVLAAAYISAAFLVYRGATS